MTQISSSPLYPFQHIGAAFLASRKQALLADEMGLGKTVQAIRAADQLKATSVLVVCPASLKLNWEREWRQWSLRRSLIQVVSGTKAKITDLAVIGGGCGVTIINYELLINIDIFRQLLKLKFEIGVFDESHYLKGRKSQRTKAVLLKHGVGSRCKRLWFMTGTPVLNRPIELFPILRAASPSTLGPYTTYTSFARKFCGGYFDGFMFRDTGATNTGQLNKQLRSGFMLRRLKSEVLAELPPRQYQIIPMKAPNQKIEDLIGEEFNFTSAEAKYKAVGSGGAELALLRHELALAKVKTAVQLIQNEMLQTDKLVVFAYHRDVLRQLHEELYAFKPTLTMGGVSSKMRQDNVDAFQNDPDTRIFIGQITAAGVGITLTAASRVFFVETSWVPGDIDQAIDRVHRIGQKDSVLAQFLVLKNSLEENMLRTVIDKRRIISEIVDKDIFS